MTKSSSSSSSIVAKDVFDSRRLLSELKLDHLVLLSLACFDLKMTKLDNYEKKTKWAFTNVLLTVSVILTCTKASLEWYLYNRRESTIWKIFKSPYFLKEWGERSEDLPAGLTFLRSFSSSINCILKGSGNQMDFTIGFQ